MNHFYINRGRGFEKVTEAEYNAHRTQTPPTPTRGLGDLVATVAEPIARASDALLGTKLVGCGGCAKRKAALNALVPNITKPTTRAP